MSFLHDIWNPWHGCVKCSEGCQNCYMYFLDRMRDQNGAEIYKTKSGFSYPLQKDRTGHYKIQSGEQIRVCMTSDFFLEEADPWRVEAWDIMRQRSDVVFFLLTKRPQRVRECLPPDWGSGWDNIFFNVTCENQRRADERIPILFDLPFKHKGIMCAPFIGPVSIRQYLSAGQIEQVICGGENYDGARPCNFDWVKSLRQECVDANVTFCFIETGTVFIKDGKRYHHILDPKTGYPVWNGLDSVTIVCDNGLLADGLSTACFVLGMDDAMELLEKYDADAMFVDEDKNIYLTDGMKERFELMKNTYTVKVVQ